MNWRKLKRVKWEVVTQVWQNGEDIWAWTVTQSNMRSILAQFRKMWYSQDVHTIWCLLKSPITIAHNVFTVRNQNGWESQVKYNFDLCYFMIQYY